MAEKWFISDTHFQHKNIIKFGRPFSTIEEHDEHIIQRWNEKIKPGDKVYHLGDVMFGDRETFKWLWSRLNGRKRLIMGNHDDGKYLGSGAFFEKMILWKKIPSHNLILSHCPLHPETLTESRWKGVDILNVHGHTHEKGSPQGPYRSVCLELTDYYPVHLEEIRV